MPDGRSDSSRWAASAAIVGGFVGDDRCGAAGTGRAGVDNLVLVQAVLLAGAAVLTRQVSRSGRLDRRVARRRRSEPRSGSGSDYVRLSRVMRLIAIAYVLFRILFFPVLYPFLSAMTAAFPEAEVDLATASDSCRRRRDCGVLLDRHRPGQSPSYARFGDRHRGAGPADRVYLCQLRHLLHPGSALATAVGFPFCPAGDPARRPLERCSEGAGRHGVPAERRAPVVPASSRMACTWTKPGITIAGLLPAGGGRPAVADRYVRHWRGRRPAAWIADPAAPGVGDSFIRSLSL